MAKNIHDHFMERVKLAKTYLEDGALIRSEQIIAELAGDLKVHRDWVNSDEEQHPFLNSESADG